MELFVVDDEVLAVQQQLASLQGVARLDCLITLAWYLRERNTDLALETAREAREWLAGLDDSTPEHAKALARLTLLDAEVYWLRAEIEFSSNLAEEALHIFTEIDDAEGCCDAHWLRAFLAVDNGLSVVRDTEFDAALHYAFSLNDSVRQGVIQAALARFAVLRSYTAAQFRWGKQFFVGMPALPPAVATWAFDFLGLLATQYSDFGNAATLFMRSHEAALQSGQIRRAINAECNIGDAFTNLNDPYSALEWMQNALTRARPTGWPWSIGGCLYQLGETLRCMGRLDEAQELLSEALHIMVSLSNSRTYAIALQYQGDLSLARGEYQAALETFLCLDRRGKALRHLHLQIAAKRGQAHALSYLGQPEQALEVATAAWGLARKYNDLYRQVRTLQVLAQIHHQHDLPAPPGMQAPSPCLHYLLMAKKVAQKIEGYSLSGDLLNALSRAFAEVGDHVAAWQMASEAIQAYAQSNNQEATHRAIAVQVQRQTERSQAEGEYHRQLAQAEANRAEILQRNSNTLARLGAVGQEITAQLDQQAVFRTLHRHAEELLDVDSFGIYLTVQEGNAMELAFGIEDGKNVGFDRVDFDDPEATSALCARERRVVLLEYEPGREVRNLLPGTLANRSLLFAPLLVGARLLGVMTVQSRQTRAYEAREQLIFRTLCSYGAIALDNAHAYDQLQKTQAQLVEHEKMAALGALVAGVAHELNTPIGNSIMMVSVLQERTDALEELARQHNVRQSDLLAWLADARDASSMIMRGLSSAAKLVSSFKQVAVDRTTAQRREFNLRQMCEELLETMMSKIKLDGHGLTLDIDSRIVMTSYPGALGQVLGNLINNALVHGFEGKTAGHMSLSAHLRGTAWVQIQFRDNGRGIPAAHLARIFEPFFTTKMGQGGNGLGLSVSYNIVTSLLEGQIVAQSWPDEGALFILDLPLQAQEK
jgi:signal transduction histidine kinase/tetratricopeptide (TPR) repeat protein